MAQVTAYGTPVMMAEREKTVLDSLDRPIYAGGLPEITVMLWQDRGQLDWSRLAEYALRFRSQALVQRLGYLTELLDIPVGSPAREMLLSGVGKSTPYLGRPGQWGIGGKYDAT